MNALSNVDIEKICGDTIIGVFSKDEVPNLKEGYYIINLEDHRDSRCGHWTVFYYCNPSSSRPSLYFDSFGFVPPKDIEAKLSPSYIYNAKQIQHIESTACGFFCIAFVAYTSKSSFGRAPTRMDFQRFCGLFSKDTKVNDEILNKLLSQFL